jgi:hypothetical protein
MRHPFVVAPVTCPGTMRLLFLAIAASLAGCYASQGHHAALVPHATPLAGDGQPMTSRIEGQVGAINALDLIAAKSGNPADAVEVPDTQLHGALDLQADRNVSVGFLYERALAATAQRTSPSSLPVDHGDASGAGMSLAVSVPIDRHLAIGFSGEAMWWSVPWVTSYRCTGGCRGPDPFIFRGNDDVITLAVGVAPSYRTGRWTWFGGLTLRDHPTVREETSDDENTTLLKPGPATVIVHAGAEVELGAGVRASLILAQTITRDPVAYGPSAGLLLTVPILRGTP